MKNNTINPDYLLFKDFPKITGIINIAIFILIILILLLFSDSNEKEIAETILLFSIMSYGLLYLLILFVLIYFLCFSIPINIVAIILTILQKEYLTKNTFSVYLFLNSISIIVLFIISLNKNILVITEIISQFLAGIIGLIKDMKV